MSNQNLCGICGINPAEPHGSCTPCYEADAPIIASLMWQECAPHMQPVLTVDESVPSIAAAQPQDGGCWFCHTDEPTLVFDFEFDTFVHEDCIRKALEKDPNHPEARLMKYLLD